MIFHCKNKQKLRWDQIKMKEFRPNSKSVYNDETEPSYWPLIVCHWRRIITPTISRV